MRFGHLYSEDRSLPGRGAPMIPVAFVPPPVFAISFVLLLNVVNAASAAGD